MKKTTKTKQRVRSAKTPAKKTAGTTAAQKLAAAKKLRAEIKRLAQQATALELAASLQKLDDKAKKIRRRPNAARKTASRPERRSPAQRASRTAKR